VEAVYGWNPLNMVVKETLPIDELRQVLGEALKDHRRFLLRAPTGSGKSTRIPQFIMDEGLAGNGQIMILQPRRVAARMLARRVAEERGQAPGGEVGYQVRLEKCAGPETRILYLTEGLLLRHMLDDASLQGISTLIFDEFHERHLDGDVCLAQALEIQKQSRPDLCIGVMSATLDWGDLEKRLRPCAVLESKGRTFPVDIRYKAPPQASRGQKEKSLAMRAAEALQSLTLEGLEGDCLIFMPGAAEIHQTLRALENAKGSGDFDAIPLYGELSAEQQERAFAKSPRRKVIVATNVAETSLTIPGVTLVIDCGWARLPDYDPRRDIDTLLLRPISQASAEQRSGRAGRTAPGTCLRLWSLHDQKHRPAQTPPEIARLDLSESFLSLKKMGYQDPLTQFPWIEAPPAESARRAEGLLQALGATGLDGALTKTGEAMARYPLHPRFTRLFMEAAREGCLEEAVLAAALCQGRSIFLSPGADKAVQKAREDLFEEVTELQCDPLVAIHAFAVLQQNRFAVSFARKYALHAESARQAGLLASQYLSLSHRMGMQNEIEPASLEIALRRSFMVAFNDRLAKRLDRGTLRCALPRGKNGLRRKESSVDSPFFVSAEIEERNQASGVQILLGMNVGVEMDWLKDFFPDDVSETIETLYDGSLRRVVERRKTVFRDLVLEEEENWEVSADKAAVLLAAAIQNDQIQLKAWDATVENWIKRVNFVAAHWPEYEIARIGPTEVQLLLEQFCHGASSMRELKEKNLWQTLETWLNPAQKPMLEKCAPERLTLANGRPVRLRYEENEKVVLSATVQKLYDLTGPVLIGGRVAAILEILAPNQRPIQITDDLEGFWERSYPEIRRQLKGRYPKHEWR